MGRLEGKAVVVTGAARGLGEAYVRALIAEGASVIVNDIDEAPLKEVVGKLRAGGGNAVAHHGDVGGWDFAESLIDRCVDEFGRIDGLVNNAGVLVMNTIEEQDEASFRHQFDVNLFAQAFCGIHALRRMIPRKSGSVINTFSGSQVGVPFRCAYSAATSGIAGLTYSWAAECAGTGVRVNAIAPVAATREIEETEPFLRRLHAAGRIPASFTNLRETMKSLTAEMNAPMVTYLLSDAAATVNGQALRFTGKELMLLTRPAVRSPALTREEWTADLIEEAFLTGWRDMMLPLGLAEFEMKLVRNLT